MRKVIDFVKKPLLYITTGVFTFFMVLLIIISCLPHGKKYSYSMMGMMDIDYIFKGNQVTLEVTAFGEYSKETTEYEIKKGILYVKNTDTGAWNKVGKINAYKIVMEEVDEDTGVPIKVSMNCKANKTVRTLSITMMCIFGVLAAGCVTVLILDKKGIIKLKTVAENTSSETSETGELTTENTAEIAENPLQIANGLAEEPTQETKIEE